MNEINHHEAAKEFISQLTTKRQAIETQIARVVIGQHQVVEMLLITLLAGGNALLMGVPGLAKTLLVKTLGKTLGLETGRIQFTPDLMPADVTGSDILEEESATRTRAFRFAPGPVFCNLLLADEINRTPPKTQAALLQAMQEKCVSVGARTYPLPEPFHVFATQNPIDQEGTYPLPEAQLDRFMCMVEVGYPSFEEELLIAVSKAAPHDAITQVLAPSELLQLSAWVREVPTTDLIVRAAVLLTRMSRPQEAQAPDFIKQHVRLGAGPRATAQLLQAAGARALLCGRYVVDLEDIWALAVPVLAHRWVLDYRAQIERITASELMNRLLEHVKKVIGREV